MKEASFLTIIFMLISSQTFGFEIHGHRGARSIYPENTLIGFEYALNSGADFVEIDIHLSLDEKVVIYHDPVINSDLCIVPSNIKEKYSSLEIANMLLADLKTIDCGTKTNKDFKRQRSVPNQFIPSLEDLLQKINTMNINRPMEAKINIEFKVTENMLEIRKALFVDQVLNSLTVFDFKKHIMLQSFDLKILEIARSRNIDLDISYLGRIKSSSLRAAVKNNFMGINPKFKSVRPRSLARARELGLKVVPYTVNREKDWKKLINMGVDGIITDDPEGLSEFLCKMKQCN
ncbi:MAG: glycerophosphodiester phosphodiesterase family protein [Bdellovibrionales bacterium]